jgi:hypothetical protein
MENLEIYIVDVSNKHKIINGINGEKPNVDHDSIPEMTRGEN